MSSQNPDRDVISENRLSETASGDPKTAQELLEEYVRMVCDELPRLVRLIEALSFVEATQVARAIKGASVSVGAERVAFASSAVESACRDAEPIFAGKSLRDLEGAAAEFLAWHEFAPDRRTA